MLDASTFTDQDIINISNEKLIPIKIDAETDEGMTLFNQFQGTAYPMIVFLDKNNNEIDRFYGYLPPYEFLIKIKNALNNTGNLMYYLKQYNDGNHSAELIKSLADKYKDKEEFDQAISLYQELLLSSNVSKDDYQYSKYTIASLSLRKNEPSAMIDYLNQYPSSSYLEQGINDLIYFYQLNGQKKEEFSTYSQYIDQLQYSYNFLNNYAWRMSELDTNLNDALNKINLGLSLINKENTGYSYLVDTKAEILWKLNDVTSAVNTIEEAILINPDNQYYQAQKDKFLQK